MLTGFYARCLLHLLVCLSRATSPYDPYKENRLAMDTVAKVYLDISLKSTGDKDYVYFMYFMTILKLFL